MHRLIDHESFLSFGVALTFFTLGVVGILGSDDILCCFVVGNSFTWDDWFRKETEDHAFQDVIDQLLNTVRTPLFIGMTLDADHQGIFLYIGAVLPWSEFGNFESLTPWRLVVLGICVMLLRRMPWVMLLVSAPDCILLPRTPMLTLQGRWIPALPTWRDTAFAGFFGPIGVGAIFYTQVALEFLPPDREHLRA